MPRTAVSCSLTWPLMQREECHLLSHQPCFHACPCASLSPWPHLILLQLWGISDCSQIPSLPSTKLPAVLLLLKAVRRHLVREIKREQDSLFTYTGVQASRKSESGCRSPGNRCLAVTVFWWILYLSAQRSLVVSTMDQVRSINTNYNTFHRTF